MDYDDDSDLDPSVVEQWMIDQDWEPGQRLHYWADLHGYPLPWVGYLADFPSEVNWMAIEAYQAGELDMKDLAEFLEAAWKKYVRQHYEKPYRY